MELKDTHIWSYLRKCLRKMNRKIIMWMIKKLDKVEKLSGLKKVNK